MRAALEWIAAFVGATVLSAVLCGALTLVLGKKSAPEGAVRFDETYDGSPHGALPAGVTALYALELGGVNYRSLELGAPYPFQSLQLSVEGASGHPPEKQVTAGVNHPDLKLVLPEAIWAGVEVEVACGP